MLAIYPRLSKLQLEKLLFALTIDYYQGLQFSPSKSMSVKDAENLFGKCLKKKSEDKNGKWLMFFSVCAFSYQRVWRTVSRIHFLTLTVNLPRMVVEVFTESLVIYFITHSAAFERRAPRSRVAVQY